MTSSPTARERVLAVYPGAYTWRRYKRVQILNGRVAPRELGVGAKTSEAWEHAAARLPSQKGPQP